MKKFTAILILLCCIFAASASSAVEKTELRTEPEITDGGLPAFRSYTARDGIPESTIMSLAIDRRNSLWVGTQDGTAYYHGRNAQSEGFQLCQRVAGQR
jgi:ligand-binding sensor domain-containing protein